MFYLLFDALISVVSECSGAVCGNLCGQNASRPISGELSPGPDGKRFAFLCGVYCNSEGSVMQVVSEQRAAQRLSRYRQRIASRICYLKAKLTFPQQLSHSRNLSDILRESILKYENVLVRISVAVYNRLTRRNTSSYLRHRHPYHRTIRNQRDSSGSGQLHQIHLVNADCRQCS